VSSPQLTLALALLGIVGVVLDGESLPSAPPARIADGRVVVPAIVVARLADRVITFPDGSVNAIRGERDCVAAAIGGMVPLAPLARCLGAHVAWDAQAKTVSIAFAAEPLRSHPPYDPNAPRVAPTTIFTPQPPPPTPRVIATGVPRPRRTAIPATPSFPQPATSLRPRSL
jgi:hypothetical protein